MATLVLEVQDKKLKFFRDLIQHFSFVTIRETELDEDTDEQVIENIRAGVKEMRLVEQGKVKSRPAREFLKEL
ncbi:hypothetical protein [Salmonirosea aquatica]|uniref:Uncharacterized protein n=1 Tax=Salmonirosea aquatica TaxID=2654236 RepID=A0A7C9F4B4_9BACT|nr:hypothetical protein [Cytophagaceae bacterium SJW1-29]